jgi:hypothetical protein
VIVARRGRVELDALSDPRDDSRWAADYLISIAHLFEAAVPKPLSDTSARAATAIRH